MEVQRYTTENPQGNVQYMHNATKVINREVFLRDWNGEGDLSLVDFCRAECKKKCNVNQDASAEEFGEYMDCDCIVSAFYHIAVGHAELRLKLMQHEDANEVAKNSSGGFEIKADFIPGDQVEIVYGRNNGLKGFVQEVRATKEGIFYEVWLFPEKQNVTKPYPALYTAGYLKKAEE